MLLVVVLVLSSPAAELPLALAAQEIPGPPNRDPDFRFPAAESGFGSDWQGRAGTGLRAELPSGTERVMRFDSIRLD